MNKLNRVILIVGAGCAMALGSALAMAQNVQKVATGDFKTGTYSKIFREYKAECGNSGELQEIETNGSVANVDLLIGNKVNAAIVQTDVLFFRAQTENLANIKTLFNLYPEEIHVIARGDVKKEGGILGFGGKEIKFNTVSDLAGRNVGAVGGSVITAKLVNAQGGIKYNVVEYPNNDALKAALLKGEVDAIVVVGGQPHSLVASLDRQYKLLTFSPALQNSLKTIYSPARLSYANLDQRGVDSMATESSFVTRTYKSKAQTDALKAMRSCFEKKLDDIKDQTGTHPKWQAVDASNHGKWAWYDLP